MVALGGLLVIGGIWIAAGTATPGAAALLGLWAPLVDTQATAAGIPASLELGIVAHESGGDYLAVDIDPDGTVDAGLGQINSLHWAQLGLAADPFDPALNVAASVDILAAALQAHPGHPRTALEAYNGFGPDYAAQVLAAVGALAAAPQVAAWPIDGQSVAGVWQVPDTAGDGRAYLLVTAFDVQGSRLAAPNQVTATQGGRPLALATAASAPSALRLLTPPDAAYWWTVARLPVAGPPTDVGVTAVWRRIVVRGKRTVVRELRRSQQIELAADQPAGTTT